MRWLVAAACLVLLAHSREVGGVRGPAPARSAPRGLVIYSGRTSGSEYTHDEGPHELFLAPVGGGPPTQLTHVRGRRGRRLGWGMREPRFSPDGRVAVFLCDFANSNREQRLTMTGAAPYPYTLLNVWIAGVRTGGAGALSAGDLGWRCAEWSPAGRWIAAVYPRFAGTFTSRPPDDVYVIDSTLGRRRRVARGPGPVTSVQWSSHGASVFYASRNSLYRCSRAGGLARLLWRGPSGSWGYRVAPDGRSVAYVKRDRGVVAPLPGPGPPTIGGQVVEDVFSPAGRLDARPQWSRDGHRVAFAAWDPARGVTRVHVVQVPPPRQSSVAVVRHQASVLGWSRDGRWVIVHTLIGEVVDGLTALDTVDGRQVALFRPRQATLGLDWRER